MGRIWLDENIKKSQSWYPSYSASLLKQGQESLGPDLSGEAAKTVIENAKTALRRRPLSDAAFIQIGLSKAALDKTLVDPAYLSKALSRNNRNRLGLRFMLNVDLMKQNFDGAVEKLDILMRLSGGNADIYRDVLRAISATQDGRDKIDSYLKTRVSWGRYFVLNQINALTLANKSEVAKSIESFSSGDFVLGEDRVLHENYMRRLVGLGAYEEASLHWTKLNDLAGINQNAEVGAVFNGRFERLKSLPPFNWVERQQTQYYSELTDQDGLIAVFGDDKTRALTNQVIRLSAGQRYALTVDADWGYRENQGLFFWAINCLESGERLTQIELNQELKLTNGGEQNFEVPNKKCDWQRISLFAKPGRLAQHIRSSTRLVKITALAEE